MKFIPGLCISALLGFSSIPSFSQSNVESMSVKFQDDTSSFSYIRDNRIFSEGWNELPQVNFWKKVVSLSPDSGILNIASSRQVISKIPVKSWNYLNDSQKNLLRDSVRNVYGLNPEDRVLFTVGKNDFYDFSHAIQIIGQAYKMFEAQGVPAFYAQSILLIECPGRLQRSSAGAQGHFQLMPGVATSMGLKVNKYVDERKDFEKCAGAAAKFIQTVCIPNAEKVLTARNIAYKKSDLWFKLLVLHVYHAGSGNVAAALDAIQNKPAEGNIGLITTLWQTKAGAFGNASQNYSQIALANTLILYDLLQSRGINIMSNAYAEI
jgi:hypothetical protein